MGEEELFEIVVMGGHGEGEFGAREVAGEAFGEGWRDADGFLDDISEFGGMRGGKDEPLRWFHVFLAVGLPGKQADSGVRIGNVAVAIPDGIHFGKCFFVGGAVTPDFLADIFDAIAAEVEKTRKVVGIADVHGVGTGGDGGARAILAGEEIFGHRVVGIGGGDESRDRQADALGEDSGGEIAEISTGYGDDERHGSDGQLAVGGHVIEHLREQPANIDGIGGGEESALIERFIGEGLLDEALTVVEGAGDFQRGDIFAERGELLFLGFADALGRIQDDHANTGNAEEAVRDGTAGVAGSGDQDSELARFSADEIAHQAGQKARTEILKGERGAVEEFEDVKRG